MAIASQWLQTDFTGCRRLLVFIVGGLIIRFIDYLVPHMHLNQQMSDKEGILNPQRPLSKTMLLYLAVVIHNIPEGLAVGVANATTGLSFTWMSALGLAL